MVTHLNAVAVVALIITAVTTVEVEVDITIMLITIVPIFHRPKASSPEAIRILRTRPGHE